MANNRHKSYNKKVRNARKVEYANIQFDSKLEVYCYKKLKEANLKFEYTEHRYVLVDEFKFIGNSYEMRKTKAGKTFKPVTNNIRQMTYTPDFVGIYPHSKRKFIIETKGQPNDQFSLRWKFFKKYITDNNIDADLFVPRNHTQIDEAVNIIKTYKNEIQKKK